MSGMVVGRVGEVVGGGWCGLVAVEDIITDATSKSKSRSDQNGCIESQAS
jgi:hypothetical protein